MYFMSSARSLFGLFCFGFADKAELLSAAIRIIVSPCESIAGGFGIYG